jgi:ATP phosphoribosyltransferase
MTITFALPSKGAIAEPTLSFLKECGLRVEKPNERQYTGSMPMLPQVGVLFQRVKDVLYKVADGTAQIGITGYDVVQEFLNENVVVVHDALGYGHCQLTIAVPETWVDVNTMADLLDVAADFREYQQRNLRIATTYTALARQYLHQQGIHHFTLVKAEGAIEAAPTIGYADIVVDLTQTGTTLRENHLKMLSDGVIVESQACLIANKQALKSNPELLQTLKVLLEYIDAALNGKRYQQMTVNILGSDAESVAHKVAAHPATRGLQGPTIAPIYSANGHSGGHNAQWYTVTIIVHTKDLLQAVEYLRSIGASQMSSIPLRYAFLDNSPTYTRLLNYLEMN